MKRLTTFIAATSVAVTAGAGAANAADIIVPQPPVTPIIAPAMWSGFYVGAFAGYNFGEFDPSEPGLNLGTADADGFAGGGFAGINFQNGAFVYGAEAEIGFSDAHKSVPGARPPGAFARQGLFGSLRARLGYAFDPFMIYATAGVAATDAEIKTVSISDSNTHWGWTVGAGAEAMVTESVFGRLEYRYTDYESKDFDLGGNTLISSGFKENTVRAGLGVRF